MVTAKSTKEVPIKWAEFGKNEVVFRNVGLGGIQNQLGVFDEQDLVTLVGKKKKKKTSQKWKLNVHSVVLIGLF